jgi:hypothetical protein
MRTPLPEGGKVAVMFDLAGSSPQDEVFKMQQQSARLRLMQESSLFLLNPGAHRKWLAGEQSRIGSAHVMVPLTLILLIIGTGLIGHFGWRVLYYDHVQQNGTPVEAQVVDLFWHSGSRNSRSYYVDYVYVAADRHYQRRQQISSSRYSGLIRGITVPIVYDKESPGEAFLTGPYEDKTEQFNALMFGSIFGLMALGGGLICAGVEYYNREYSRCGRLLPGRVIRASGQRGGKNMWNVTIHYEFDSPEGGRMERKTTRARNDLRKKPLPKPGTPVAVLYLNPNRIRLL